VHMDEAPQVKKCDDHLFCPTGIDLLL
jgi:hypothetical protein